ncbi:MAG: hypothetical protein ACPHUF_03090 [Gammaproteobacteria bacterium]
MKRVPSKNEEQQGASPDLWAYSGVSGCGKSTAIAELVRTEVQGSAPFTEVTGAPINWSMVRPETQWVVLDELRSPRDVFGVFLLLADGHRIIAASHLPDVCLQWLSFKWVVRLARLDRDPRRLGPYLDQRGVSYSDSALTEIGEDLQVSFTLADLILEYDTDGNFDNALARFRRSARVTATTALRYPTQIRQWRLVGAAQ